MAHLIPYPFGRLLSRVMRELEAGGAVLDLPPAKFVRGPGAQDWSVAMHGARAATALGPAAGPHTQLAQNIVLAFLGAKGALSADGMFPAAGGETARRALASIDPEIAGAKCDLAAIYTQDFVKRASAKYPRG